MSNKKTILMEETSDREIVITRVFNAPRERVWKAWTDPEHLVRWWAPKDCTTPSCKVDLRPSGRIHFCMRMPDGKDIWGLGVYREIVEPERIVYVDSFADAEGNPVPPTHYGMSANHPAETLVTVTFVEQGGKTKVTLRHSIPEAIKERKETEQGWIQMLERLTEHLSKKPAFELVLERVIDASRARVYEAWTKPEQMTQWFAPKPFKLVIEKMDFRSGGRFSMAMRGPDGKDFPFTGTYREIVPPERLVWTGEFTGGPADQMTTVVTFEDQGQKTKIHVQQTFHVMTPEIEQRIKGAKQGWTMTLDQLEAFCSPKAGASDRIEKRVELKVPVSRVWRAVTDYQEFGEWFRVKLDGPFVVGQVSRGHITYPGYEHLKWEALVKEMKPEKVFSFTWHPYAIDPKMDYFKEPTTLVEFRLEKTKNGTLLTVTESGFDKVPIARRVEAFRMNDGGWTEQMKNIENHVAQK